MDGSTELAGIAALGQNPASVLGPDIGEETPPHNLRHARQAVRPRAAFSRDGHRFRLGCWWKRCCDALGGLVRRSRLGFRLRHADRPDTGSYPEIPRGRLSELDRGRNSRLPAFLPLGSAIRGEPTGAPRNPDGIPGKCGDCACLGEPATVALAKRQPAKPAGAAFQWRADVTIAPVSSGSMLPIPVTLTNAPAGLWYGVRFQVLATGKVTAVVLTFQEWQKLENHQPFGFFLRRELGDGFLDETLPLEGGSVYYLVLANATERATYVAYEIQNLPPY